MKTYKKDELVTGMRELIAKEKARVADIPKNYEAAYKQWRKGVGVVSFRSLLNEFDAAVKGLGGPAEAVRRSHNDYRMQPPSMWHNALRKFGEPPSPPYINDDSERMSRALDRLLRAEPDKRGHVKVYRDDPLLRFAKLTAVTPIESPRREQTGVVPGV